MTNYAKLNAALLKSTSEPGHLLVNEVYGPTLQGEGPTIGSPCVFLRLATCNQHCSWCFSPDTPVLMADWSEKLIRDVVAGDFVMSYRNRRYEVAKVERTITRSDAERVAVVAGGKRVVCTPDHVFATARHADNGATRATASNLVGKHLRATRSEGWMPDEMVRTDEWWSGWLQGVVLGDGHVGQSEASPYPKVWLRVCDKQLAEVFSREVNKRGAATTVREQARRTRGGKLVYSVVCVLSRVPGIVGLPETSDEVAGFLAGFFDAEGSVSWGQASISQRDTKTLHRVAGMCRTIGVPVTVSETSTKRIGSITINGLGNVDRFMRTTRPILDRKREKHRSAANRMLASTPVEAVIPTVSGSVVNLTTSTGFFFANGFLVEQCDTPFTWKWDEWDVASEAKSLSYREVKEQLVSAGVLDTGRVVISGGEPMLQWKQLTEMFAAHAMFMQVAVEIETAGTIAPRVDTDVLPQFNVSPKLANSGNPKQQRYRPKALMALRDCGAVFKFVVADPEDFGEIDEIVRECDIDPSSVYVMPEGVNADDVRAHSRLVAGEVIQRNWRLTTRLQVELWGNKRGV